MADYETLSNEEHEAIQRAKHGHIKATWSETPPSMDMMNLENWPEYIPAHFCDRCDKIHPESWPRKEFQQSLKKMAKEIAHRIDEEVVRKVMKSYGQGVEEA